MLDQPAVHGLSQLGGKQAALFLPDVVTGLDHLDRRRKCARPADPELLERLDQRGFGVARRRLGEVLLRLQLLQVQLLVDRERGQFLVLIVVRVPLPDTREAVEDEHRTVRPENVIGGAHINSGLREACGGHLAGGKSLPDQAIELELIRRQEGPHRVRRPLHIGRPDRLVRILHRALRLEFHLVAAGVSGPELLGDEVPRCGGGLIGDAE